MLYPQLRDFETAVDDINSKEVLELLLMAIC
jgi:hypothetical protein